MTDQKKYYQQHRREVEKFLPDRYSRTLEIGCGEGQFSANLALSCERWGIEPIADVARIASDELDRVLTGTYEQVCDDLPEDYFDLIICNDVIEHMQDHEWFLTSIKQKMQSGAYLIGSIPNVRFMENLYELLIRKDWEYKDWGILDRTHLRFFTERSIKRMLHIHGFAIEDFHGINGQYSENHSFRVFLRNTAVRLFILLSFGYFKDIEYLQFGFRVRLKQMEQQENHP